MSSTASYDNTIHAIAPVPVRQRADAQRPNVCNGLDRRSATSWREVRNRRMSPIAERNDATQMRSRTSSSHGTGKSAR
jgi:hypothetical protein